MIGAVIAVAFWMTLICIGAFGLACDAAFWLRSRRPNRAPAARSMPPIVPPPENLPPPRVTVPADPWWVLDLLDELYDEPSFPQEWTS